MNAGSGAEVLNESDYDYLANELSFQRDVLMDRLTTRQGIGTFKVDQLKKVPLHPLPLRAEAIAARNSTAKSFLPSCGWLLSG
jgi:hypothetical protein